MNTLRRIGKFVKGGLTALLLGFTVLEAKAQTADDIELLHYVDNSNLIGSTMRTMRISGSVEGNDSQDVAWTPSFYPPADFYPQFFKIFSDPFGTHLYVDARSLNSETLTRLKVQAIDQQNSQGVLPATSTRLGFNFDLTDIQRNYIISIDISGSVTQSGQPFNFITNASPSVTIQTPVIKSLANGELYNLGSFSRVSKSKTNSIPEDTPLSLDLSTNQVSGLTYAVGAPLPLHGAASIQNGTNLVYTSNTNFFGSDKVIINLLNPQGNSLGYQTNWVNITPVNDAPIVANPIPGKNGTYGSSFAFTVPGNTFSDPDGDVLTYSAANMPSGIGFNLGTTTFSGTPLTNGVYTVSVIAQDTGGLKATNAFNLAIAQAPLTASSASTNRVYGATNPAFTGSLLGLVNGDTLTQAFSTSATSASPASAYPITFILTDSGNKLVNYAVTTNLGALIVVPKGVRLFANSFTNRYGDTPQQVSWGIEGLVAGEGTNVFSGSPSISSSVGASTVAGMYPLTITPGSLTASNYSITNAQDAVATVVTAPLTFSLSPTNVVYGNTLPTIPASVQGVKLSDSVAASGGVNATNGSPVGLYSTFVASVQGPSQFNLKYGPFTTNASTLQITPRIASISVLGFQKEYGHTNPVPQVFLSNFVAGDGISVQATPLVGQATPPGLYDPGCMVQVQDLQNKLSNYAVTTNISPVVINQAQVQLSANDASKVYGDSNPGLTGSLVGDALNQLQLGFNTPVIQTTGIGTYSNAIIPQVTGPTNVLPYYDFSTNRLGAFTVTPAPLEVRVADVTRTVSQPNPSFTFTSVGWKNGETNTFSTFPLVSTQGTNGAPAGTYSLIASGAQASNYTLNYIPGTLTIIPDNQPSVLQNITVTPSNVTLHADIFTAGRNNGVLVTPYFSPTLAPAVWSPLTNAQVIVFPVGTNVWTPATITLPSPAMGGFYRLGSTDNTP